MTLVLRVMVISEINEAVLEAYCSSNGSSALREQVRVKRNISGCLINVNTCSLFSATESNESKLLEFIAFDYYARRG